MTLATNRAGALPARKRFERSLTRRLVRSRGSFHLLCTPKIHNFTSVQRHPERTHSEPVGEKYIGVVCAFARWGELKESAGCQSRHRKSRLPMGAQPIVESQ